MLCATCLTHVCAAESERGHLVRPSSLFLLFPLGMALLWAALLSQGGIASASYLQPITPTPDRLAKPTLPAVPSQADYGAQAYWLYCLPCHGDRGQGLTQEFRSTYPPEDRECWNAGCHGERPYEHGWTLPKTVPRLIGDGALSRFPDAASLAGFIRAAMPYQAPGSLDEPLYWQITAFLLRENRLWDGRGELSPSNAAQVAIHPATPTPTPTQIKSPASGASLWLALLGVGALVGLLFLLIARAVSTGDGRRDTTTTSQMRWADGTEIRSTGEVSGSAPSPPGASAGEE